ncbi:MAG: hypothetical protein HYW07_04805 [Candidatus Latescibacteria bacterium]|nr:hypothetical protein [Candidatus Latescibacterota bacterium]
MKSRSFEEEWAAKVKKVRGSNFWQQVSSPPSARIERAAQKPRRDEVAVDEGWSLMVQGEVRADGPAQRGLEDLRRFLRQQLGLRLKSQAGPRQIVLALDPKFKGSQDRWKKSFELQVEPERILVRAASEIALLRASLWLSNYWSLRRNPYLKLGRRRVKPSVSLHLGADLWGGFSTTQAWVHGRERDDNFLELARMGLDGFPLMALFEDYVDVDPAGPWGALYNPEAKANRKRLAQLARKAARCGVYPFLMAYNPKLAPDHPLFKTRPRARGALQGGGAFRTLCASDPATRRFIAESWASLFGEIPELGGLLAITGGEGFYHCYMRSRGAVDCPRCSQRPGSEAVAELVNAVAGAIRSRNPQARLLTWPYSANHWSGDRDQVAYIGGLDPENVIFQTEVDKDSVDWREAGYAKNVWDYSMSRVTPSERILHQRRLCRQRGLPFSVKLEVNTSIECLNVPYLPVLENQRRIWENARRLQAQSIHSRWLFDGSCKSPSEELGFWTIWGQGTEFADLKQTMAAIARRDFGEGAAPQVLRAWARFSAGMRHHPQLDYYVGTYFIGAGQPLVLRPEALSELDPAFFGVFYWLWEDTATDDDTALVQKKPLFFSRPGFSALARRGSRRGQDVALSELQEMARLWEQGMAELEKARPLVPAACRKRFAREYTLAQHLAYTWRSGARVEEFLRVRDTIRQFSGQLWVRSGHVRENMRDYQRLVELARAELQTARQDLKLVQGVDFLDLGLRLDMGVASAVEILEAKICQVEKLLAEELPRWREELLKW